MADADEGFDVASETSSTSSTGAGSNKKIILSKDKYDKLISEFQKYKSQNSILKKAVIQEQKKNEQLTQELEKKEVMLREKSEENSTLQYNNIRLEKRLTQLMYDLEEKKKTKQGGSFFGLIQKGSSELEAVKKDLEVALEELESKIMENETVHMQVFELKKTHDAEIKAFNERMAKYDEAMKSKENEIQQLIKEAEAAEKRAKQEEEKLNESINKLKQALVTRDEIERAMNQAAQQLQSRIDSLRALYDKKVPFDDTKDPSLNALNIPPFNRAALTQEVEFLTTSSALLKQLVKVVGSVYSNMTERAQVLFQMQKRSHYPSPSGNSIEYLYRKITALDSQNSTYSERLTRIFEAVLESKRQRLDDNSTSNTSINASATFSDISRELKNWILFHQSALLYLVALVQESDRSSDSASQFIGTEDDQNIMLEKSPMSNAFVQLRKFLKRLLDLLNDSNDSDNNNSHQSQDTSSSSRRRGQVEVDIDIDIGQSPSVSSSSFSPSARDHNNDDTDSDGQFDVQHFFGRAPSTDASSADYEGAGSAVSPSAAQESASHMFQKQFESLWDSVVLAAQNLTKQITARLGHEMASSALRPSSDKLINSLSSFMSLLNRATDVQKQFFNTLLPIAYSNQCRGALVLSPEYNFATTAANKQQEGRISYYNNTTAINVLESRAKRYMNALNNKLRSDTDQANINDRTISQKEARQAKKMVESLRKHVESYEAALAAAKADNATLQQQLNEAKERQNKVEAECIAIYDSIRTDTGNTSVPVDKVFGMIRDEFSKLKRQIDTFKKQLNKMPLASESPTAALDALKNEHQQQLQQYQQTIEQLQQHIKQLLKQQQQQQHNAQPMKQKATQTQVDANGNLDPDAYLSEDHSVESSPMAGAHSTTTPNEFLLSFEDMYNNNNSNSSNLTSQPFLGLSTTPTATATATTAAATATAAPQPMEDLFSTFDSALSIGSVGSRSNAATPLLPVAASDDDPFGLNKVGLFATTSKKKSSQAAVQPNKSSSSISSADDMHRVYEDNDDYSIVADSKDEDSGLFGPDEVLREEKLRAYFENRVRYLMAQIEICDAKSVEYRIEWQNSLLELEQVSAREKQFLMELKQTQEMLQETRDELETVRRNYEMQIQQLSDQLTMR